MPGSPGSRRRELDRFAVTGGARVLQFAAAGFDASVLELCMAFGGRGGAGGAGRRGPLAGEVLASVLRERRVTHALIVAAGAGRRWIRLIWP